MFGEVHKKIENIIEMVHYLPINVKNQVEASLSILAYIPLED